MTKGPSLDEQRADGKARLLAAIAGVNRGADLLLKDLPEDQAEIDAAIEALERINPNRNALAAPEVNGRWELVYTTSASILGTGRPAVMRPQGKIYQLIDTDHLTASNWEAGWPFSKVFATLEPQTATKVRPVHTVPTPRSISSHPDLDPLPELSHPDLLPHTPHTIHSPRTNPVTAVPPPCTLHTYIYTYIHIYIYTYTFLQVRVQFRQFRIFGLIPVKAGEGAAGWIDITYLDEEMRIARGDKGNTFVLLQTDPDARVERKGW